MTAAPAVHVELGERSYDIVIGAGNLAELADFAAGRCRLSHIVVITDEQVEQPYAMAVAESFAHLDVAVDVFIVPAGEMSKSVEMVSGLWNRLLAKGVDRKTVVVAVGGGVIGDLAGFVAASYARGLPFFQVPTTLLAQVDSSVGGKVGINLPGAKNMVGAFWQPRGVLIDTNVLATLPEREYRAGLAEVVKYGVILDAEFFAYLEAHVQEINARQAECLRHIITRSCRLKADVVEADEREETGARAALNYGHTFAHAFEAVAGYGTLLHGEAVSIGMVCAARLAERLQRLDTRSVARQVELLSALDLPIAVPQLDHDALIEAMARDKKVEHGRLRFVLADRIGHVELVEGVDEAEVRAVLAS